MRTQILFLLMLASILYADDRGIKVQAATKAGLDNYDPSRFYALVIGINEYREWTDLRSAKPDAVAVSDTLVRYFGYLPENVKLLTDAEATRRNILAAIDSYAKLGENDSLFIYYAGHGWMDDNQNGFWVPTDAPLDDKFDYISCARIVNEYFKKYRMKHLLVMADSCFAGAMMRAGEYKRPDAWKLPAGFSKPSRWIVTSGDLAPVEDDAGSGHSPFATRLLQYLKYSDEQAFGVADLYVYIRKNLRSEALANPLNTPQHMPGGEFVFARLDNPIQTPDTPAITAPGITAPAPTPAVTTGGISLESRLAGDLFVDGKRQYGVAAGRTYTLGSLAPGSHRLNIDGKPPWEQVVTVEAGKTVTVVAEAIQPPTAGKAYTVPTLDLKLVPIASGRFNMGCPSGESDEQPIRQVTISRPYWLGAFEVTARQFLVYLQATGNDQGVDLASPDCPIVKDGNSYRLRHPDQAELPIACLAWDAANAFAEWVNQREKAAGRLPARYLYRLPTEAEWEYACRAGSTTPYAFGSEANLDSYAWYSANAARKPHPVGGKRANAWGLYDINGNVWEWCRDWYDTYPDRSVADPIGPTTGRYRIVRGGSWDEEAAYQRSGNRGRAKPDHRRLTIGLRLALAPAL